MSETEKFLTRWSRRKQEAVDEAKPADRRESKLDPAISEDGEVSSSRRSVVSAGTNTKETKGKAEEAQFPVFDPQSLPSIDSIVADTDIRGFLAPGVPEDLKRAALQQMWRADPAIRDFIGLSENSWDFNAAGGPHGFEPLEITEQLKAAVEAMFEPKLPTLESDKPQAAASPETGKSAEFAAPETTDVTNDQFFESAPSSEANEKRIAALQPNIEAEKSNPSGPIRGHGSALPK